AYLVPLCLTLICLGVIGALAWANWTRLQQIMGSEGASESAASKPKAKAPAPKQGKGDAHGHSKKPEPAGAEHPAEDDQLRVAPLPSADEPDQPPRSSKPKAAARSKK